MPKREDETARNYHPEACTCVACNGRRLIGGAAQREMAANRDAVRTHPRNGNCQSCSIIRDAFPDGLDRTKLPDSTEFQTLPDVRPKYRKDRDALFSLIALIALILIGGGILYLLSIR